MLLATFNNTPATTFLKGQTLLQQGQECSNFIFITKGQIKVFARSDKGKEVPLYYINPSELCVLTTSCLMSHDTFPAEAVAETDIEVHIINKQAFHELLATSSEFRQQVFDNFGSRLKDLILKIETITSDSLSQRLGKFLLNNAENGFVHGTHNELAHELGCLREAVSRALKTMEKNNWIKVHRGKIEILNAAKMQTF